MIRRATYENSARTVSIAVERIDTWVEDTESVINFPGVLELDNDRLVMIINRSRHGAEWTTGEDPHRFFLSEDGGQSWHDAPADFPLIMRDPHAGTTGENFESGSRGRLRDGTIAHISHGTQKVFETGYDRNKGHYHTQFQEEVPTFRWHRWKGDGTPIEDFTFSVEDIPWFRASYQCYAKILELQDGDLLAALEWVILLPEEQRIVDSRGRAGPYRFGVFIVRSSDRGRSWKLVHAFDPQVENPVYGAGNRPVDEGFVEADLAVLCNDDILCVMRTGSYSPMWQSRSTDGGRTWSKPESTGWQGVKPRIEVLPNGVLACAAGRGAYGHPQVTHVMLSLDGTGKHWEYPFAFHTGPGCSYTSTMQREGRLHVVYSDSDFTRELGTHRLAVQAIRRAVIDVQVQ